MSWGNQSKNTATFANASKNNSTFGNQAKTLSLGDLMLQENGSALLQESNFYILLADGGPTSWANINKH